jgi:hypothetical protein
MVIKVTSQIDLRSYVPDQYLVVAGKLIRLGNLRRCASSKFVAILFCG